MGAKAYVPPPPDPWGVFQSPHARTPYYRAPYTNTLAPTPWLFRGPNRPLLVLVAMTAAAVITGAAIAYGVAP